MLIKRYLFNDLTKHLPKKEMSLIIGPRQAGKTTLMLQLQDYLNKNSEKTLFLSLDFERDFPHFVCQTALLGRIQLEFSHSKGYVFLDEIQRKEMEEALVVHSLCHEEGLKPSGDRRF